MPLRNVSCPKLQFLQSCAWWEVAHCLHMHAHMHKCAALCDPRTVSFSVYTNCDHLVESVRAYIEIAPWFNASSKHFSSIIEVVTAWALSAEPLSVCLPQSMWTNKIKRPTGPQAHPRSWQICGMSVCSSFPCKIPHPPLACFCAHQTWSAGAWPLSCCPSCPSSPSQG